VDRAIAAARGDRAAVVDRLAEQVEDAAERFLADGDGDGRAGIGDVHPAAQAVGRSQRHRADASAAQVRRDLAGQADWSARRAGVDLTAL
jgi:hypothetical protein